MAKRKKKEKSEVAAESNAAGAVAVMDQPQSAQPDLGLNGAAETAESIDAPNESTSFAVRHPRQQNFRDPNIAASVAHHNAAGVQLLKHDRLKQAQLRFTVPVPTEITKQLREEGWTHRPTEGIYTKQYGDQGEGPSLTRAKHLYFRFVEQMAPASEQGRSC